jgi:NAD(P)-dependent dehydrogenase (short-subunit alcohol dehydrogenase family)
MDKPQVATSIDVQTIRNTFEPNFFGLIQTTTIFLPLIRASSTPDAPSVILNVSTDMASNTYQARPNSSLHVVAYNTSKAAANSYTIALAHELKAEGIKVNCATPGFTTTKLNGYAEGGKTAEQGAEMLLEWSLLGKDGKTGGFYYFHSCSYLLWLQACSSTTLASSRGKY